MNASETSRPHVGMAPTIDEQGNLHDGEGKFTGKANTAPAGLETRNAPAFLPTEPPEPGSRPERGVAYWAVVTRPGGGVPIVRGSHYGVKVDLPEDDPYEFGRVFSKRAAAESHLETLLTHDSKGRPIERELAPVYTLGTRGYWYDAAD